MAELFGNFFLNRERLGQMPKDKLYNLHGRLNIHHASRVFKTWKNVKHQEFPAGSFFVSVVEADRKFLQIHFAPFGLVNMSFSDATTAIKTLILGFEDCDKMFNLVDNLANRFQIKEISGETNSTMAHLAVEMGLTARNHKINKYANIVSTLDIPQFLRTARSKVNDNKLHYQERLVMSGISEKNARIDAILTLLT